MDLTLVITFLVITSALYSYLNARFLKLPGTIGIIVISVTVSVLALILNNLNVNIAKHLTILAKSIDFPGTVLNIMLGFLLFAGSFNINVKKLKEQIRPILVLSTIGVVLNTFLFGWLFYEAMQLLHIELPLIYSFLFGALISPTDPVSVAAIIKQSNMPERLETITTGESLFNDGLGIVLFITILEFVQSSSNKIDLGSSAVLFAREVLGGVTVGLILGVLANRLMHSITDFETIVLISLALVMGVVSIANALHLSIPLSVVSAGIVTGARSINIENKERSHQSLETFWKLIDEMLNIMLFVMIGVEVVVSPFLNNYWLAGGIAIVLVLAARWLSITVPVTLFRRTLDIKYSNITVLTWAGVRGAISIALALSLPHSPYRELILAGSFFVVIFSVVVQGLTLNKLINRLFGSKPST